MKNKLIILFIFTCTLLTACKQAPYTINNEVKGISSATPSDITVTQTSDSNSEENISLTPTKLLTDEKESTPDGTNTLPEEVVSNTKDPSVAKTTENTNENITMTKVTSAVTPKYAAKSTKTSLDRLRSYEFELDGKSYKLPFTIDTLTSKGWKLSPVDDSEENALDALEPLQTKGALLTKGKTTIEIGIINQTPYATENYDDLFIFEVEGDIKLPGGIKIGSSTDKLTSLYGKQVRSYKYSGKAKMLQYVKQPQSEDTNSFTIKKIDILTEGKKVTKISLANVDIKYKDLIVKVDKPYSYNKPAKLSSNFLDCTFQLEGNYYCLPAPLSTFLDNKFTIKGWLPDSSRYSSNEDLKYLSPYYNVLPPDRVYTYVLTRNKKNIIVDIKNEYDTYQSAKDCTVIGVRCLSVDKGATLKLPGNITIGSTEKSLLTALDDTPFICYNKSQIMSYLNESFYENAKSWNRYVLYDISTSQPSNQNIAPYSGKVAIDVVDGKVKEISLLKVNKDSLGSINPKSLTAKPDENYQLTEEVMIKFLCYNGDGTSSWNEENYIMQFSPSGYFNAYSYVGNPWFLMCGDTVDATASYTIDAKNQVILVKDYDRTVKLHYTINSYFEMMIQIEGKDQVYYFYPRDYK